jgi:putative tryptophan/tyrosine transport system substrate-binding protein
MQGKAMKRREFFGVLGGGAAWPLVARAEPLPVIGFVHPGSADEERLRVDAFLSGLNEAGYIPGQNVNIEYRWFDGDFDRVPTLLSGLINKRVTVIVAAGGSVVAAKAMGTNIPIVFTSGSDPIQQGIVTSLSHPDGNMTGVAFFATALGPKQLELLLAVAPAAKLLGFVTHSGYPYAKFRIDELQAAAHALERRVIVKSVASRAELEPTFAAFEQQGVGGLIVSADPILLEWREELAALAARHAMPACYGVREFVLAGGLMSYGSSLPWAYHQVGVYTARILKGEKPADLPVVQAVTVELVLNLKAAKNLGFSFPLTLLGRADEVIE